MKKVSFEEIISRYPIDMHTMLKNKVKTASGFILFENNQMDSSQFGAQTLCIWGPNCTYKTPEAAAHSWLYDLPSQRQYPTSYCELPKE